MGFFDVVKDVGSALLKYNPATGPAIFAAEKLAGTDLGTLAGDALTGGAMSNNQAIQATNAQNIAFAREQTQFQERMSNTAYQRATTDMKAAGINPMLAYSQGGASVPTGVSPQLQAGRPGDVGAGLLNTAKEVLGVSAGLANTQADTSFKQANTALNEKQAVVAENTAHKLVSDNNQVKANTALTNQQLKKAKYDTERSKAEAAASKYDSEVKGSRVDIDKKMAPIDAITDRIYNALGSLGTAFRRSTAGRNAVFPGSRGPRNPSYEKNPHGPGMIIDKRR